MLSWCQYSTTAHPWVTANKPKYDKQSTPQAHRGQGEYTG